MSPICVLGKFHGLEPEVWVGARETDKVIRKSPAASAVFGFVVGRACIPCCLHEANEAAVPCRSGTGMETVCLLISFLFQLSRPIVGSDELCDGAVKLVDSCEFLYVLCVCLQ